MDSFSVAERFWLSWAGCSQPLGKSLSRKAIAAVLLPKRFDHGCFAGGLAIGELVSGPESRRSLELQSSL